MSTTRITVDFETPRWWPTYTYPGPMSASADTALPVNGMVPHDFADALQLNVLWSSDADQGDVYFAVKFLCQPEGTYSLEGIDHMTLITADKEFLLLLDPVTAGDPFRLELWRLARSQPEDTHPADIEIQAVWLKYERT